MDMDTLVGPMSEDDGIRLLMALEHRFGWAINAYTRTDVEDLWERTEDAPPFDDEAWQDVQHSYTWRHLFDPTMEIIWETLGQEITEQIRKRT